MYAFILPIFERITFRDLDPVPTWDRFDQSEEGQQLDNAPSSPSMIRATLAPNSRGLPSQITISFFAFLFNLNIFSMLLETSSTAAYCDRPAYLAAQLASKARVWMADSPSYTGKLAHTLKTIMVVI
jgi:hypothetical protein